MSCRPIALVKQSLPVSPNGHVQLTRPNSVNAEANRCPLETSTDQSMHHKFEIMQLLSHSNTSTSYCTLS